MLARLPYNADAVAWSDHAFDDAYAARWWPRALPTLIVSGGDDRIVDQILWRDPRFAGAHVEHRVIAGAGHFPWFDAPAEVGAAFRALAARLT
jgi:pimeloyl-ACP methyl ester carboxylesterase